MILPSHLRSSYKIYKQDTDDVAAWLAETALSLGHDREASPNEGSRAPTRADGNERIASAQPKSKNQRRKAAERARRTNQYMILLPEFTKLASYIASQASPLVKVPLSVVQKLRRSIDARRECNRWCQINAADKKGDAGHGYFLAVLEEVLETLRPLKVLVDGRSDDADGLGDDLSHLQMEEPSTTRSQPAQTPAQPDTTPPSGPKYQAEALQDEAEAFFAGFTLFTDIFRIHTFVTELWKQYHQGLVDLMAASVISTTAIDLVRRIEEDFFNQFPLVKDADTIIKMMYVVKVRSAGREPPSLTDFDEESSGVVHFVYGDMLVILSSLAGCMAPDVIPINRPGYFGVYRPETRRDTMTVKQRFDEDTLIIGELVADLWFLAKVDDGHAWEDGLTKAFRILLETQTVHVRALFAARVFLDVHHLLRETVAAPFKQLQTVGRHLKESWTLTCRQRAVAQDPRWSADKDEDVRSGLVAVIEQWLESDFIGLSIRKLVQGQVPLPKGEYRLLRQHPLMCGLLAFYLYSTAHRAGVSYANATGAVMYTSHLYNAVQQDGSCTASWPNLELMFHMQSEKRIFIGGRPQTPEEYLRRFCLCIGVSAEQFAEGRRHTGLVVASRGPRTLQVQGELSEILHKHYCHTTQGPLAYLKSVERLMNSKFVAEEDGGNEPIPVDGVVNIAIRRRTDADGRAYLRQKPVTGAQLSLVQLLLAMKGLLLEEIPKLVLDYFYLHRSCRMMLDQVREACHHDLVKYCGPDYLKAESELPFVVGYIFLVAFKSYQVAAAERLQSSGTQVEFHSKLLNEAGRAVQTMLTSRPFGPRCGAATFYVAAEGRLMYSRTGEATVLEPGAKVDLGGFEMIYRPE